MKTKSTVHNTANSLQLVVSFVNMFHDLERNCVPGHGINSVGFAAVFGNLGPVTRVVRSKSLIC
jgi:hypothetical protein